MAPLSIDKRYYKISEVAEMLDIPATTLRFWEKQFTIINPKRNDKGVRYYTPADIEKIRMIYFLVKQKGLKLEAAQDEIRNNASGISKRYDAIARLRDIRATLSSILKALNSKMQHPRV